MKFSANKDGAEQSDDFFKVQLKTKTHLHNERKTSLNLRTKFIPFLSNW